MIYFLQRPDGGPIKIGTTIRLSERLKALCAEVEDDLRVLAVIDGDRGIERALHERFADLRTAGEWFEPGDDLIGFIVAEGRSWDGSDESSSRHARIELPDDDYQRLKRAADRYHISVAAYIRMAVMERIERDEGKGGPR